VAEVIPFNRSPWPEGSYEFWCVANGFDTCETNRERFDTYRAWAVANGITPFWEIPF